MARRNFRQNISRLGKRVQKIAAPIFVLALVEFMVLVVPGAEQTLRHTANDLLQTWIRTPTPPVPLTVVTIDERAENREGFWPWPRDRIAELVDRIAERKPALLIVDLVFAEQGADPGDTTTTLAESLRRIPSVISVEVAGSRSGSTPRSAPGPTLAREDIGTSPVLWIGETARDTLPPWEGEVVAPPAQLGAAARGLGVSVGRLDDDGVMREIPMILRIQDTVRPSIEAEAMRVLNGGEVVAVTTSGSRDWAETTGLLLTDQVVPLTPKGTLRLNYGIGRPYQTVSAADILSADTLDSIEGRIVLLGVDIPLVGRQWIGADRQYHSSIWLHAQAVSTILSGRYLSRPNGWTGWSGSS